jgi:hypothetical protein
VRTATYRTAIVLLLTAAPALAGNVRLVSDTWDNIPKVEVVSGSNAPQQGTTESFADVQKGWNITRPERICYRRSSNPSDANSGLNDWTCGTELLDKTSDLSLQ